VYRGKWHNNDVAIKVMTCSHVELPRVLKEAEIMIGLEHDNIVRALHCLVVDKQPVMESSDKSADQKVRHIVFPQVLRGCVIQHVLWCALLFCHAAAPITIQSHKPNTSNTG
jgi:hypothetical protein